MGKSKEKTIVFDFDKTLTLKDTNLGFFMFLGKRRSLYPLRLIIYLGLVTLRKLRVITNLQLKNMGLSLFAGKQPPNDFMTACHHYASTIVLNDQTQERLVNHREKGDHVIIATASLTDYVRPLFPDIEVFGSELEYFGKGLRLKMHCYQEKKVEVLQQNGIQKIDVLYTDSLSDIHLARMAEEIMLVKKGAIVFCPSIDDFITALKN